MKKITTSAAIDKAMALFKSSGLGDMRTIALCEGSGSGSKWSSLDIHIGYAKDGDYTESDANPFVVHVQVLEDGAVTVNRRG